MFDSQLYVIYLLSIIIIGSIIQYYVNQSQRKIIRKQQQLEDANAELKKMAMIDMLTQLPNRNAFYKYIEENLLQKGEFNCQLIVVDIDFFKQYNDMYGHPAGDKVLADVAQGLQTINDIYFVRWGGEEFIGISIQQQSPLHEKCEQILHKVSALKIENLTSTTSPFISVSIGASHSTISSIYDIEELYQTADKALYEAKKNGRNSYVVESE